MKRNLLKNIIIICMIAILCVVILVLVLLLLEQNLDKTQIINNFNNNRNSFEKAVTLLENEREVHIRREFGIIKISHKVDGQYKLQKVNLFDYGEYKEIINFMIKNNVKSIYKDNDNYIDFGIYCSAIYCQYVAKIDNQDKYLWSGHGDRSIKKITGNWYYTESD